MKKSLYFTLVLAGLSLLQACSKDSFAINLPEAETALTADDTLGKDILTDNSEDDVSSATFERTVKVTYAGSTASVSGASDAFAVTVDGAGVTITNNGSEVVIYELSGSSPNG